MFFPLFNYLTEEQYDNLKHNSLTEKQFSTGEYIFRKGKVCSEVYAVIKGYVDLFIRDDLILKRGMGAMLLYMCMISDDNVCPIDVLAQSDVTVKVISMDIMTNLIKENENLK